MKNKIAFIVLISVLLLSCAEQNPTEQIKHLEGYWEITSVEMPDGTTRDFSISTTVDYIMLNEDGGVRTKVAPQLDGSFNASETREKFSLKIEQDSLRLYYQTPYYAWKETVLEAKDSTLVVKNAENKIYSYKRFSKFSVN